jgi:hypothetical protein
MAGWIEINKHVFRYVWDWRISHGTELLAKIKEGLWAVKIHYTNGRQSSHFTGHLKVIPSYQSKLCFLRGVSKEDLDIKKLQK